jgi:hypothetical protein
MVKSAQNVQALSFVKVLLQMRINLSALNVSKMVRNAFSVGNAKGLGITLRTIKYVEILIVLFFLNLILFFKIAK